MHGGRDPPGPQGVEEHGRFVNRLVAVVLVEEVIAFIVWIDEPIQLIAKDGNLRVIQDADARQVAILLVEGDLVVGQAMFLPLVGRLGNIELAAHKIVAEGQVFNHRCGFSRIE